MLNPQLETFVRVVEAGSFNKAANDMFITPTAVIKQMNALEGELGVVLFVRTHRGLTVTKAAESLYKDVKFMQEYSRKAVQRAKNAMQEETNVVRIGTSPMTPAQMLTDLWPEVHKHCADISFRLVSFENTPQNAREILRNLGEHIDVVTGPFDETLLELRQCAGFQISRDPTCCAVSIYHPLAQKDELSIEDLYGESVMMIHRGWSRSMDAVRDELAGHPEIQIEDFDFYDIDVFNQCEQQKKVLPVIDKWSCVHPMMKVLPVKWNHVFPFGVLHSKTPSPLVERFLEAVRLVVAKG